MLDGRRCKRCEILQRRLPVMERRIGVPLDIGGEEECGRWRTSALDPLRTFAFV